MADTWGLLKRIGLKKYDELKESFRSPGDRIDKDLPLGLRFNGIVEIPQVDFILAGDLLKIKYPGSSCVVARYGMMPLGRSEYYHFYLQGSYDVYMLEVITDQNKVVQGCRLFMTLDEVVPDDWAFWLDERDGYIGYDIFDTKDQTRYYRVWDSERKTVIEEDDRGNQITRIAPFKFLETVYLDPYGEKTEVIKYDSMLYGRKINEEQNEYLLVSAVEEPDEASIQILVGIELQPVTLKII